MPQRELGLVGPRRELVGLGVEERRERSTEEPEHQRQRRQDDGGRDERGRGGVDRHRSLHLPVAEGSPHEAGRVGRGEDRPEDHPDDEQPPARRTDAGAVAVAGDVDERDEHALLGDVAEQRGETRHRRGGEHRGDGEDRQAAGEARQLTEVARAGAVVDHADDEEEGRLEQRVREQQGEPGEHRAAGAGAEDEHEEAELADGAVGEQQLEVVLAECSYAAEDHRREAEHQQHRAPSGHAGEGGRQERDEVDAGLDHRRGVQVRADRGRCRHGRREPEVEGEQGRLADGAHQEELDTDGHGHARGRVGQDLGDAERPGGPADDDRAHEEHEAAERGHHERLDGGAPAGPPLGVVPDQEEGEDGRELPEHVEQQQVVGQHQAEHRGHEGDEHAGEARDARLVVVEVPRAVGQHERADAEHDQRHHPLEGAHRERQVQADAADPRVDLDERLTVVDGGALCGDPRRTGQRHQRDGQEGAPAGTEQQPRRHDRRRQQSGDQHKHKRCSSSSVEFSQPYRRGTASSGRWKGCSAKMGDGPHPGGSHRCHSSDPRYLT